MTPRATIEAELRQQTHRAAPEFLPQGASAAGPASSSRRLNRRLARRTWARFSAQEIATIAGVPPASVDLAERGQLGNARVRRAIDEALELALWWRIEELRRETQQEHLRAIRTEDEARARAQLLARSVDPSDPHPGGRCRHDLPVEWCATCLGSERRRAADPATPEPRGPRCLGPQRAEIRLRLRDNYRPKREGRL